MAEAAELVIQDLHVSVDGKEILVRHSPMFGMQK